MKVFVIATGVFQKGGIERYTRYQYQALKELLGGDNVFIASLLGRQKDDIFEEHLEVDYIQGGTSIFDKIRFLIKCILIARKNQIDLIICNHRQLSVIGFLCKKILGIKYITNVYGLEIWSGLSTIEQFSLLNSDRLIGDCNFIINYISKHYSFPVSKMDLLYDAVDTKRFLPVEKNEELYKKYSIPKGAFVIATIGRLVRNKGHAMVINTLPSLDKSIIYLVVGGGNQLQTFKKQVADLNLQDRVIFTNRIPESELVDCYNIADMVVLLSVFDKNEGEGLPLGLIEASACGKPIVCGNEDGSQDAISLDFPNGLLINPRDKKAVQLAVEQYFNDKALLEKHGENGRRFVLGNFAYEIFSEKQKGIINSLK